MLGIMWVEKVCFNRDNEDINSMSYYIYTRVSGMMEAVE
jgi:hypothetical protein